MKKNWNILLLVSLLCLSGGLLGSCTDEMEGRGTDGSDKITMRVQLNTKADATADNDPEKLNDNEYRIRSIRLYAFDGEVLDNMVYKSGLDDVSGVATVDIAVTPRDNKTFYVVVNEPDDEAIHMALALANRPNGIKQVQYSIAEYLNSRINALSESGKYFLPMYQEQTADILKTTTALSIGVDRAVARIDVYMIKAAGVTTEAKTDNATLKVERSIGNGYISSDNVQITDPALAFDMNNAVATTLGNYTADYTGYEKIYSFYVPEQSCVDEEHRLRFTLGGIVWGGQQMSTPYNTFYLGNDASNKLNKITRNTVYRIYCRIKPTTKDVTFNIVTMPWGIAPKQDEQTEKGEINMVNCYMVTPGGSINIPVQNVYRFWSWSDDLPAPEPISKEMEVAPEIIWTDTENLITSVDLLNIPNLTDKKDHARIKVQTAPGKQGNAVIGMRMKSQNGTLEPDYRWSWHVWVTDYNPESKDASFTKDGVTFMDRNLGALTNNYDQEGTVQGLNYQWGRKDPFPSKKEWIGDEAHYGKTIEIVQTIEDNNLANAIKKPTRFFINPIAQIGDWYTTDKSKQNNLLWQNNKKTIYDPCPEGWRIPSTEEDIWTGYVLYTSDWDIDAFGRGIKTPTLGYYPFATMRRFNEGTDLFNHQTGFWFAAPHAVRVVFASCMGYADILDPRLTGVQRASGYSVRCVKE